MSIIENSNETGTENLKSQSEEATDENNNNTNVISDNGSVSNQTSENMIENNDQENEKDFKDEEKIIPPFYTVRYIKTTFFYLPVHLNMIK